jgi:hypothetical protein
MKALGYLGQIDYLEAQIQARVADFLTCKKRLMAMKSSSLLTISFKAEGLYGVQLELETQLTDVLDSIKKIKEGAYTFSDITSVAAFAYTMDKHVKDVDSLDEEFKASGGVAEAPKVNWLLVAGFGIGAFLILRR